MGQQVQPHALHDVFRVRRAEPAGPRYLPQQWGQLRYEFTDRLETTLLRVVDQARDARIVIILAQLVRGQHSVVVHGYASPGS